MEDIKNKSTKDSETNVDEVNDTNNINETSNINETDEQVDSKSDKDAQTDDINNDNIDVNGDNDNIDVNGDNDNIDVDRDAENMESIKSQLAKITKDMNDKANLIEDDIESNDDISNKDEDVSDENIENNKDSIKDIINSLNEAKELEAKELESEDYEHKKASSLIKAYDFEKSRKFSASNVKFLEALSNEFCKSSNLQLHYELKHENLKLKFSNSRQTSISNFIEKTAYNTVLLDFTMGRAKNLIIKVDKICALTFVECLLGGDGSVHNKEREVTEIDSAIVKYLCEKLLNNLSLDTPNETKASVENIFVNTAKFKTPVSFSENLFISNIDVILKDTKVGEISICAPTISLEGKMNDLISRMSGSLDKSDLDKDELLENENKVINALCENKVAFDIVAELGKTNITVGELLSLDADDVLILNRKIDEPIDVLVGGSLAYKAQPALVGTTRALVIQDLAEKGDIANDGEENN